MNPDPIKASILAPAAPRRPGKLIFNELVRGAIRRHLSGGAR